MQRVLRDQKTILRACVAESNEIERKWRERRLCYKLQTSVFPGTMMTGVESLCTLNSELEACAETIRAQVHALGQQIFSELSQQHELFAQLNASSRAVNTEEWARLQAELADTKAENERNLRHIDDVEAAHAQLSVTYGELAERYEALQCALNELREANVAKASIAHVNTADSATSTQLDGATVENLIALNGTIQVSSIFVS